MRYLLFILIAWTQVFYASSQEQTRIRLSHSEQPVLKVDQQSSRGFTIHANIPDIFISEKETSQGSFQEIQARGLIKTFHAGYPDLPVFSKLIEVPLHANVQVEVVDSRTTEIQLNDKGMNLPVIPARPPVSKAIPKDSVKFNPREKVYNRDQYYKKELVLYEPSGIMRNKKFGRIEIAPFEYNPVKNTLRVHSEIQVKVRFIPAQEESRQIRSNTSSPYFSAFTEQTINSVSTASKGQPVDLPVTYVVVSDRMFESTLQPFIEWKEMKGFHVIEAYTDSIGTTPSEIKSYLQDLYENPAPAAPTFVLFVGDIEQVPSWNGQSGSHYTDLYYCEYTDDYLPEVFYGRFSAKTTDQLQNIIDKNLLYEKLEMVDPSYLSKALLVAGNDESHEDTYGNGQINYATSNYFNSANGLTPYAYLQEPPNGNAAVSDSMLSHISQGVSIANYTAHCSPSGWSDPQFSNSDVSSLTNQDKYGLWIGNCCESAKFNLSESFAEVAIRAQNKGAVAYIGGSADTYWDEDYWWAVGLTSSITSNPTYEESGLGLFDRLFHTNGENMSEWYDYQGQLLMAGNLAVEASTSGLKRYYWEVYHLMGDPSIMPFLRVPDEPTLQVTPDDLMIGMSNMTVSTEAGAYVALRVGDELVASGITDQNGDLDLQFDPLDTTAIASLAVNAKNHKITFKDYTVRPADQPYVGLESFSYFNDENNQTDYGDTIRLNVRLKNLSDSYTAYDVRDTLFTNDKYVSLLDSVDAHGTLEGSADSSYSDVFTFVVSDSVQDQHEVHFDLNITGKNESDSLIRWKNSFLININAPSLSIGAISFVDSLTGNGNAILDPGEISDVQVEIANKGHSAVSNLEGFISIPEGNPYLTLIDSSETLNQQLTGGMKDTFTFRVQADPFTPMETDVNIELEAAGGNQGQYQASQMKYLTVGDLPDYRINQEDSIYTCSANFYDSGGETGNYSDNENHTVTFFPASSRKMLQVDFTEFAVEDNYDQLSIYNGPSIQAPLAGQFDSGNPPESYLSSDTSGALTFRFTSDGSVRKTGWKAFISCVDSVTILVTDGVSPVEGAEVTIASKTKKTGANGKALFFLEEKKYIYTITKGGYYDATGTLNVAESKEVSVPLSERKYNMTFQVRDSITNTSLDVVVQLGDSSKTTTAGNVTFTDLTYNDTLTYRVIKEEYNQLTGDIVIQKDSTMDVFLSPKLYEILLKIKDPAGNSLSDVQVQLDTLTQMTGTDGQAAFQFRNGTYSLKASKNDYTTYNDSLEVSENKTYQIVLRNLYDIRFTVKCAQKDTMIQRASISIDTLTLVTDQSGAVVAAIPYGVYLLTVSADGYQDYQVEVDISSDKTILTRLEPERDIFYLGFTVKNKENDLIENARISIDTSSLVTDFYGKAEVGLPIGDYNYTVKAEGYTDYNSLVNLQTDTSVSIVMEGNASFINTPVKDAVRFYPNPTTGQITITSENSMSGRLIIRNVIGAKVDELILRNDQTVSVNLQEYEKGIYLFIIDLGDYQITRKVLYH